MKNAVNMNVSNTAKKETALARRLTMPGLRTWLCLLALAGAFGCTKEKVETFEPPQSESGRGEGHFFDQCSAIGFNFGANRADPNDGGLPCDRSPVLE